MPVTGVVTGHTVQIPHIGSDTPASNTYGMHDLRDQSENLTNATFPVSILMGASINIW